MTTKDDWNFRAEHLEDQATYLDNKADEFKAEAARYRGLAEQARYLGRQTTAQPTPAVME